MKKLIIIISALITLTSCSEEYRQRVKQEQFNKDQALCESYGAKFGTPPFIQCMATLEAGTREASAEIQAHPITPATDTIIFPNGRTGTLIHN